MSQSETLPRDPRTWIARIFTFVEDIVYVGLGLLLASSALYLLVNSGIQIAENIVAGSLKTYIVELLDQILLILLIVELLYTVQVSFREHTIVAGPFLLVGLIAAIRRVLILTAEFGEARSRCDKAMTWIMIELGVLTVLVVALVVSIRLLRRSGRIARAKRA